jgi:PAS domain S-box-containing protein
MHKNQARHRTNFIRAPVPMLVLDAGAVVADVSDRCLDLLGYSRQEAVGRHLSDFQTGSSARQTEAAWGELLALGEFRDVERCFLRRDGTMLDVLLSTTVERPPGGGEVRVIAALADVTGRKRAEAALKASEEGLHHAQKLEAIGQLTSGIAHDFNNVLQAVSGNLELIRRRVGADRPEVMHLAETALSAVGKAADFTSQLLAFSRGQRFDLTPFDPVEVIDGMRSLLARAAGDRIALRIDDAAGYRGACLADPNQLECALLNLVINARDAIGGAAGTISISVAPARMDSAPDGGLVAGEYVRITVLDDGPGMPEEVRGRAFEPFFTTKQVGKGSGLGLAQIHGFARQSGGTAIIESAPGKGTEVTILLPSTGQPIRRVPDPPVPAAKAEVGSGETLLIVEDDELVRTTLADTLSDLGYRIIEADDADAALALLDNGIGADVVLTDLSMPGSMDGLEFASVTRHRFPTLPVILTTGHTGVLSSRALPPGVNLVSKPYSFAGIASAIKQALAEGGNVPAATDPRG